jgi:hypothetical protein
MTDSIGNRTIPIWAIAQLLDEGSLRLPSFQRDAVWDEERVELLWDSLLRGIPLGNLIIASQYLSSRRAQGSRYDAATTLTSNPEEPGPEATACGESSSIAGISDSQEFLIDGQQRAIAIRQGLTEWHPAVKFRLWIDAGIAPEARQRRREHTVRYPFFLCTPGFPWGAGITDAQRRACRTELADTHPDRLKEPNPSSPDYRLSLGYTWPAKASLPLPFATIARWLIKTPPREEGLKSAEWAIAKPLIHEEIEHCVNQLIEHAEDYIAASNIRARWQNGRSHIVDWIGKHQEAICRALNRQVYVEVAFEGLDTPDPEELGEAFSRINRLGVRLDGADLFFSALKLQWPEAHNFVWSVYKVYSD